MICLKSDFSLPFAPPTELKDTTQRGRVTKPYLNELLCSEADFHIKIDCARTTTSYKRRKILPGEMSGFDSLDPNNEFIEEVHVGRRCLLCCSNVILTYDSSTGGWCL